MAAPGTLQRVAALALFLTVCCVMLAGEAQAIIRITAPTLVDLTGGTCNNGPPIQTIKTIPVTGTGFEQAVLTVYQNNNCTGSPTFAVTASQRQLISATSMSIDFDATAFIARTRNFDYFFLCATPTSTGVTNLTGLRVNILPCLTNKVYLSAAVSNQLVTPFDASGFAQGDTFAVFDNSACSGLPVNGITVTMPTYIDYNNVVFSFSTTGITTSKSGLSLCINTGYSVYQVVTNSVINIIAAKLDLDRLPHGVSNVLITATDLNIINPTAVFIDSVADCSTGVSITNTAISASLSPLTPSELSLRVSTRGSCLTTGRATPRFNPYQICAQWTSENTGSRMAYLTIEAFTDDPRWTFPTDYPLNEKFVLSVWGEFTDCINFSLVRATDACTAVNDASLTVNTSNSVSTEVNVLRYNRRGTYGTYGLQVTGRVGVSFKICYNSYCPPTGCVGEWLSIPTKMEGTTGYFTIGSMTESAIIDASISSPTELANSQFATGSGTRTYSYTYTFSRVFANVPQVMSGISGLDIPADSDSRMYCAHEKVTTTNMSVRCTAYESSKITSFAITVLATYTARDIGKVRSGLVDLSSASQKDWWTLPTNGELTPRAQEQAVALDSYTLTPSLVFGLRHFHISGNSDHNFYGEIAQANPRLGATYRATAFDTTRVHRLSFGFFAFPNDAESGYGLQADEATLKVPSLAPCRTITFRPAFVATTIPNVVAFVRGWSLDTTSAAGVPTGYAFNLQIANISNTGFFVCDGSLTSTGTLYISWAALGQKSVPL